ncbi:hypothetical protein HGRIS_008168 [Hohenbuehelia grisea]|uniref:Uncharacterized protein n=1 Tax=Hohenbuehelia grisea TaxID=104357 RepID=A0ABR3J759_9AGAR
MPTTRRQAAQKASGNENGTAQKNGKGAAKVKKAKVTKENPTKKQEDGTGEAHPEPTVGDKREVDEVKGDAELEEEPPTKKNKLDDNVDAERQETKSENASLANGMPTEQKTFTPQTGTIERGHIYFFYRPRVEHDEASSIDDVKNLHMLLVPRPPKFSTNELDGPAKKPEPQSENTEMTLLAGGADAIPASATVDTAKKHYRLITIGKKQLPNPDAGGAGHGRGNTFWAAVTRIGDDLHSLEKGLGEQTYETKTLGTRHNAPARLAARGAYAIVNNDPSVPSKRATHLGYYISHPEELGDVQTSLSISRASSFVLQVKNPLAPATGQQRGLSESKRAEYPAYIMDSIFGRGGKKGRESYGLRFASCEAIEMLDREGAELLLIGAHGGEDGLEKSLGEGRGEALEKAEQEEGSESVEHVFRELALNTDDFPQEALEGEWI